MQLGPTPLATNLEGSVSPSFLIDTSFPINYNHLTLQLYAHLWEQRDLARVKHKDVMFMPGTHCFLEISILPYLSLLNQ